MMKNYREKLTRHKISAIALILLTASFTPALFLPVPAAQAATEPAFCSRIGGSWDGSSTCTFSGSYELAFGALEVTPGSTLVISNTAGDGITVDSGTSLLFDSGATVVIQSNGLQATGVFNDGTTTNSGTVVIANDGVDSVGIFNDLLFGHGTLTNLGTIAIENTGGYGFYSYTTTANDAPGTITVENSGGVGVVNQGTIDSTGTINNYGTTNNPGTINLVDFGTFNEECGAVFTGTPVSGGSYNELSCSPLFLGIQSSLSAITTSLSDLSTSVTEGFSSLSSAISDLSTAVSDLSTQVSGLSAQVSDLSTSLSDDFNSLMSAMANVGSTGPLAGTSEGTTVGSASLDAVSAPSALSSSPGDWTQLSNATTNEVVTAFSVSATKGSVTQGVLYVTFTNSQCGCTPATFAIPVGDLPKGATPVDGVTSPHFSIPAGSTVYVQLVSGSKAGADVQLTFAGIPISGPTIVTSTST